MKWAWVAVSVAGLAAGGIGLLWFLQGSDLVHIEPIACVGDCEPVVGHHPEWQIAGIIGVLIGALSTTYAFRKLRSQQLAVGPRTK